MGNFSPYLGLDDLVVIYPILLEMSNYFLNILLEISNAFFNITLEISNVSFAIQTSFEESESISPSVYPNLSPS